MPTMIACTEQIYLYPPDAAVTGTFQYSVPEVFAWAAASKLMVPSVATCMRPAVMFANPEPVSACTWNGCEPSPTRLKAMVAPPRAKIVGLSPE